MLPTDAARRVVALLVLLSLFLFGILGNEAGPAEGTALPSGALAEPSTVSFGAFGRLGLLSSLGPLGAGLFGNVDDPEDVAGGPSGFRRGSVGDP